MKKNKIISIIIAAYNIENYIGRCLESVINQTFKDIEIIVVNDGSTDKTLDIINKYSKIDNRIVVYSQENKGSIEARKSGFKISKGEYLLFIDGDDWLELDALYHIATKAKDNNDIILFNYNKIYDNHKIEKIKVFINDTTNDLLKDLLVGNLYPCMWTKLIRKNYILENNILFPSNISYGEDLAFVSSLFIHKPKTCYLDKNIYNYYIRSNSITNKISNKIFDIFIATNFIREELCKNNIFDDYEEEYKFMVFSHLFSKVLSNVTIKDKKIHKELYMKFIDKDIDYNNPYIKDYIRNMNIFRRIQTRLYKKSYFLGYYFHILIIRPLINIKLFFVK